MGSRSFSYKQLSTASYLVWTYVLSDEVDNLGTQLHSGLYCQALSMSSISLLTGLPLIFTSYLRK